MYSLQLSEMRPTLHARALFGWDHLFMHVLSLGGGQVPRVAREAIGLLCALLLKGWTSIVIGLLLIC